MLFVALCAVYMTGLCFLGPLTSAGRLEGEESVLVPPRGEGDGVVVRRLTYGLTGVHLIDIDLRTPGVSVRVHARNPSRKEWGWAVGDALDVAEWCQLTGAIAGVNGGFFGAEVSPGRKEVIGLLQIDGKTFARAPLYRSRTDRSVTYSHSTFGVADGRVPLVDWVTSDPRSPSRLRAHPAPSELREARRWWSDDGLSGGPRLIHRGQLFVAAADERLASVGALPRTFLGYSRAKCTNRLVMATATAMTYHEAAGFLMQYFRERYGVACTEAMCLDGGDSSQLAYRSGGQVTTAYSNTVSVPTCVLVHDQYRRGMAGAAAPRAPARRVTGDGGS
jgi:hypothetical protein